MTRRVEHEGVLRNQVIVFIELKCDGTLTKELGMRTGAGGVGTDGSELFSGAQLASVMI